MLQRQCVNLRVGFDTAAVVEPLLLATALYRDRFLRRWNGSAFSSDAHGKERRSEIGVGVCKIEQSFLSQSSRGSVQKYTNAKRMKAVKDL